MSEPTPLKAGQIRWKGYYYIVGYSNDDAEYRKILFSFGDSSVGYAPYIGTAKNPPLETDKLVADLSDVFIDIEAHLNGIEEY